jgi:subtilisin family serine protease
MSRLRWEPGRARAFAAALSLLVCTAPWPAAAAARVEPRALRDAEGGKAAPVMIVLSEQADLSAAAQMKDGTARGRFVYQALTATAARTQPAIVAVLRRHSAPYQSYFVANVIAARCDADTLRELAARSEVRIIESNLEQTWIEPPQLAAQRSAPRSLSPTGIEWGVQNVNAPPVWAQGYFGQGIVVADADTGMQWDHPALKAHYRGWNGTSADHNYNWFDAIHDSMGNPCGNDASAPCDDNGHGTHTAGTTIGDDGMGNKVGVAPGARFIGCRNMDSGRGTPARYTECFQFFIAPTDLTGKAPNPDLRPHVINNSWGCPSSEGCAATTLQLVVEHTQAAGIFVEASAGNSGSGCSSVTDPPALFAAAFSTAAYDVSNKLAGFSSRGPVTSDGSMRPKPDVAAPGVRVRSSWPGGMWATLSGTSMAGPHVVGVVALLWSARPELARDIDATKALLRASARPDVVLKSVETCGGLPSDFVPNNSFGYGRVDAFRAVTW